MTYLFIIQGEGRGHMTQAISLAGALEDQGHKLLHAWIGVSPQREIPGFVKDSFGEKLGVFKSPNFLRTHDKKGINVTRSMLYNIIRFPVYIYEIGRMAKLIRSSKAERVVNFYDAMGGLAYNLSFSRKPYFAISHQFFLEHTDFKRPVNNRLQWILLRLYSFLCGMGAVKKLALSLTETFDIPQKKLFPVPPLLRKEVYALQPIHNAYILVYILNPGFLAEIEKWCFANPETKVIAFTDAGNYIKNLPPNLTIKPLDGESFLHALSNCDKVVCTAGFETVAEAAYLGKKILVIPTKNHFEQECNAEDAVRAGVAKRADFFNPELLNMVQEEGLGHKSLKIWFDRNPEMIIGFLTS